MTQLTEVQNLVWFCTVVCLQVLHNSSYATAARALSRAMQSYAQQRHPYQRAADEVELALATAAVAGAADDAAHATGRQPGSRAGRDNSGGAAHEQTRLRQSQPLQTQL
jgi:hypothetical protein